MSGVQSTLWCGPESCKHLQLSGASVAPIGVFLCAVRNPQSGWPKFTRNLLEYGSTPELLACPAEVNALSQRQDKQRQATSLYCISLGAVICMT
jgi:hypothetical protein